ncbi:G5 and 3D domain-containing protein [Bacillus sp. FJAT-27986]|uniref:G5 and 3D domain-containing protein n=1 Tax=Bacillus sp. FJAT-27986 TaxID=1743146 RepID=UPI000A4A0ECA|nr:G5 and 3D domain-containing protein [Bacillus sp. FJAT-27986]
MNKYMKNLFSRPRQTPKVILMMTSIAVFLLASGVLFFEGTKKTVALSLDGEKQKVKTHADTISELLEEHDILVDSKDYLSIPETTKIKDDLHIVWEPAVDIKVIIDDKEQSFATTAKTVEDVLKEENIQLRNEDFMSHDMNDKIEAGMIIHIEKAFPVTVIDGENEKILWTVSTPVKDFLDTANIHIGDLDRVEPRINEQLSKKASLSITRVEKDTEVVEEPIAYETIKRNDPALTSGKQKVTTEGVNGLISKKYELIKENGKVVSKKLISENVIKEKTDQVISVGTKQKLPIAKPMSNVKKNVQKASDSDEYYVTATAYTVDCDGCSGKTAVGIDLRANPNKKVIAVDPNLIPLGSRVYVEGYGYAVAGDTGGAINGNKIDVYVPTSAEAHNWGVKKVKIKVIR